MEDISKIKEIAIISGAMLLLFFVIRGSQIRLYFSIKNNRLLIVYLKLFLYPFSFLNARTNFGSFFAKDIHNLLSSLEKIEGRSQAEGPDQKLVGEESKGKCFQSWT